MSLGPRRRSSPTTWYLQANEDGTYDVLKRGRPMMTGAPVASAKSFLRTQLKKGDSAFSVAPDGYRTRIRTS